MSSISQSLRSLDLTNADCSLLLGFLKSFPNLPFDLANVANKLEDWLIRHEGNADDYSLNQLASLEDSTAGLGFELANAGGQLNDEMAERFGLLTPPSSSPMPGSPVLASRVSPPDILSYDPFQYMDFGLSTPSRTRRRSSSSSESTPTRRQRIRYDTDEQDSAHMRSDTDALAGPFSMDDVFGPTSGKDFGGNVFLTTGTSYSGHGLASGEETCNPSHLDSNTYQAINPGEANGASAEHRDRCATGQGGLFNRLTFGRGRGVGGRPGRGGHGGGGGGGGNGGGGGGGGNGGGGNGHGGGGRGGRGRGRARARIPWECRTGAQSVVQAPAWGGVPAHRHMQQENDEDVDDGPHDFQPGCHEEDAPEGDEQEGLPYEEECDDFEAGPDRYGRPNPIPEKQKLPVRVKHFMTELSTLAGHIVGQPEGSVVTDLLDLLQGKTVDRAAELMEQDSAENLAVRCSDLEKSGLAVDFMFILNLILFKSKVVMLVNATRKRQKSVLRTIQENIISRNSLAVNVSISTLTRYVEDGAKYILLGAGGGMFFLAMIAAANLKSKLRAVEFTMGACCRLYRMLRCPYPGSTQGQEVVQDIIPAIAFLRERYRIKVNTMVSPAFVAQTRAQPEVEFSDLQGTDEFFDSLIFNSWLKDRSNAWATCFRPLDPAPAYPVYMMSHRALRATPSSQHQVPSFQLPSTEQYSPPALVPDSQFIVMEETERLATTSIVVNTAFDPLLKINKNVKYKVNQRKDRWDFTQRQRRLAMKSVRMTSLEEIKLKTIDQLKSGSRIPEVGYLQIDTEVLQQKRLRINDKDGNALILIIPDMPFHLRSKLMRQMKGSWPNNVQFTDSKKEGMNFHFKTIHAHYYDRFSVGGSNAPKDVEPPAHQNKGSINVNSSQYEPRPSQEMECYAEECLTFKHAFQDALAWFRDALKDLLPKEYEIIGQYADVLPAGAMSPAYPFSGFVINFNASTRIHRDWNDDQFCAVWVISEKCSGGDLCFLEPGLRLTMASGDVVLFRSRELSHFNLHFKGERVSLVFHNDAAGRGWAENRNNWNGTTYMNVNDFGEGEL